MSTDPLSNSPTPMASARVLTAHSVNSNHELLLFSPCSPQVCDEGQRERLLSRVRSYYEILKTSQFGKHIVNRLEKLLSAGMRIQVNNLSNSPTMLNATLPVDQQQPASAADVDTVATAAAALTTAATGEGVVQSS